ncbi:MAG: hypothetical protein LAP87_17260 [Acidobacteriia bacterium]|nr:hypothetical protein [Terriglobia bacterium]
MFTWICPKCGREVPPAYSECPDCTAKAAAGGAEVPPAEAAGSPAAPPAAQPAVNAAPVAVAPQRPQAPLRPPAPPGTHSTYSLPTWLLTIVFVFALLGVVAAVVWTTQYLRGGQPAPTAAVESPAAKPGAKTNPLQKYIEVSGVRFLQDAKKNTIAKFLLTNHSDADISGLAGNVTIWGRTQKSEEDVQGTFSFTTNLGPQESKEMTAPVSTKLKIYELPDWQNVTPDLQITAPAISGGSPAIQ